MPARQGVRKLTATTSKSSRKTQKNVSAYAELLDKEKENLLHDEDIVLALQKADFSRNGTLRQSLARSLAAPFTHNPRIGTGAHGRDVAAMAISWPSFPRPVVPPGTYSFVSSGRLVEDVVNNAAYDTVARILNRAWKVAGRLAPLRPSDAILARDPAYAVLWQNAHLHDLLRQIQDGSRQPRRVHVGSLAGAPLIHFPLPRPREDVDAPPAYALLCLLPANAALDVAGRGGPAYAADPENPPRTRRVRILPTPAASNNLTGMLRKQDHLAMLLTRLPRLSQLSDWAPETPLRFDAVPIEREVSDYNALLRDRRIANQAYRKRVQVRTDALIDALFRHVAAARAEDVHPDDAPDGSDTKILVPLLHPEPADADVRRAAAAAAAFLMTRIDETAIPPATPDQIQARLREAALRGIRRILDNGRNDR